MLFKNRKNKRHSPTIEDSIIKQISKGVEKLNIISPLNNSEFIFQRVFDYALKKDKNILYILSSEEGIDKLKSDIGKDNLNYLGDINSKKGKGKINLCTYNMALYLNETYDLVIYDEVNSRPHNNQTVIIKVMEKLCNSYGTMIAYSFEKIFEKENVLFTFGKEINSPIVEPRIIQTRVNLEEELSLNVYEYLVWSIKMNKKVIIYVPCEEKVDKVYDYLEVIKDRLIENIYKKKNSEDSRKQISKFIVSAIGIIVTNDFNETFEGVHSTNIMLFFADDRTLTYKDLVYISSKINRFSQNQREEILFVCNEETENMNKCKDALRELNKEAWSQGVLRL